MQRPWDEKAWHLEKQSWSTEREGERQETAGEVGCPDYVGLCSPWGDGVRGGLSSAIKWQLKGASLLFIVQQPELITWHYPATSEALRQKERTSGCGWALVLSTTQMEIPFMSPGPVHPTTFSTSLPECSTGILNSLSKSKLVIYAQSYTPFFHILWDSAEHWELSRALCLPYLPLN